MTGVRFACCSFLIFGSSMLPRQSKPVSNMFTAPIQLAASKAKGSSSDHPTNGASRLLESYANLPLSFEGNQGQTDARVKFLSRGSAYSLFLTDDEAVFSMSFRGSRAKAHDREVPGGRRLRPSSAENTSNAILRMKLINANPSARVTGEDELAGKSNYLVGNDVRKWRHNVANYAKVKYEGIYSGIDLVYYGNQHQLEYDFVVAPGADPHKIRLDIRGARTIRQHDNGDLVLQMMQGELRWHKPVAYQEKDGSRQGIAAHYVVKDKNRVEFAVADYDI